MKEMFFIEMCDDSFVVQFVNNRGRIGLKFRPRTDSKFSIVFRSN